MAMITSVGVAVIPPHTTEIVITSISPSSGSGGDTVVFTGSGFLGVTAVYFGDGKATSFVVSSDTSMSAVVPSAPPVNTRLSGGNGRDVGPTFTYNAGGTVAPTITVGPTTPVEAGGSVVNPQFTISYAQTPVTASLTGPDSVAHQISPASLTAIGYGGAANTFSAQTFTDPGTVLNNTFTWTYTAPSGMATTAVAFNRRAWYGMAAIATYNSAFVTALSNSRLQSGFTGSYAFSAGAGSTYAHMWLPTGWSDPATFREHVAGYQVSWSKVASNVSVTNANGVAISGNIWRSPQANTFPFTFDVA